MNLKAAFILALWSINYSILLGQDTDTLNLPDKQDSVKPFKVGLFASYQLLPVGESSYNHAALGVQGIYGPLQVEISYMALLDETGIRLIFPNYYILDDQMLDLGLSFRKKWTSDFGGNAGFGYQWHYMTWSGLENERDDFVDHAHGFYGAAGLFYCPVENLELSGSIGFRSVAGIGLPQLPNDLLDGLMTRFYIRYTIWNVSGKKKE